MATEAVTAKKSDARFYLLEMSNRPVLYGDLGSLLRVEGVVIGGGGAAAILLLPTAPSELTNKIVCGGADIQTLSLEEWSDWLQRSDSPEILVGPTLGGSQGATLPKIFHRKLRYEISGAVQQKIWAADGFKCFYCGAKMGNALMTVDHFIPLELDGKNDTSNYLTACKACNKAKGSVDAKKFCESRGIDFEGTMKYLAARKV